MVTLGSNVVSLKVQRQLSEASSNLNSTFQKLSSGVRINRASDDAAGLAIANALSTQSRVYAQAMRNVSDGTSVLSIADSALDSLSNIVTRIQELAAEAANGVYGWQQRKALDAEAQALSKEFYRISRSAEFNGTKILNGDLGTVLLHSEGSTISNLSAGVGGATGTGTFGAVSSYAAEGAQFGGSSYKIRFGDLNGDGNMDMVTSGEDTAIGKVDVRLGNGDGTFGPIATYSSSNARTSDVILGDVNGDSVLDLVSVGYDAPGGRIMVRLGNGNGTFKAGNSFTVGMDVSLSGDLGDVNGDGIIDLVTTGSLGGGFFNVQIGNGNGTFKAPTQYGTQFNYGLMVVKLGDVNGDGALDLVSAGYDGAVNNGRLNVRLNQGNGTFGAAVSYVAESHISQQIALIDLNGDSILDVISAGDGGGNGRATVRLGNGNGTFAAPTSYITESTSTSGLTVTDIDGDGFSDLVTCGNAGGTGKVTIRRGLGNGSFSATTTDFVMQGAPQSLALADINNDGVLDIGTSGNTSFNGDAVLRLATTVDGTAPLLPFSLKNAVDARQALPLLQRKRELLSVQRGQVGAFQSRLESAFSVFQDTTLQYKDAESRIRDADTATEVSQLVKNKIVLQAATSVLAQANQEPSLALMLLGQKENNK